jgi:hypothetical protein
MAKKETSISSGGARKTKTRSGSASSKSKAVQSSGRGRQPAKPTQSPVRAATISEIVSIAEGLDDDGLNLLLEQAKVVEYKGKIEKFNRELNVAAQKAAILRREAGRPPYHVHIERTQDDFFIVQMDDIRIFFNRSELREMTRVCHTAKTEQSGARRLYTWLKKERSDLLSDVGINTERSPYLRNLYQVIVTTYKVKQ